jgi:hypothetical protein
MFTVPIIIYVILCLLVAWRGRRTTVGYLGSFLLSLFLTPVLIFIGLLLLTPPPDRLVRVASHERGRLPLW